MFYCNVRNLTNLISLAACARAKLRGELHQPPWWSGVGWGDVSWGGSAVYDFHTFFHKMRVELD